MLITSRFYALLLSLSFAQAQETLRVKQISLVDGDVKKTVYKLKRGDRTVAWGCQEQKFSQTSYHSGWKLGDTNIRTFTTSEAFFKTLSLLNQKTI